MMNQKVKRQGYLNNSWPHAIRFPDDDISDQDDEVEEKPKKKQLKSKAIPSRRFKIKKTAHLRHWVQRKKIPNPWYKNHTRKFLSLWNEISANHWVTIGHLRFFYSFHNLWRLVGDGVVKVCSTLCADRNHASYFFRVGGVWKHIGISIQEGR